MEFVVVLPVYFMLLGFAFVVGEMSLHSIHLSAAADRTYAMSSETDKDVLFDRVRTAISFDKSESEEPDYSYKDDADAGGATAKVSDFGDKLRIDRVGNTDFEGPWTKAVASYVRDSYTLTPLSRGFVAHWFHENERRMEQMGESDAKDTALDEILARGKLGRTEMEGKNLWYKGEKVRQYGYYSLQRNEYARTGYDSDRLPYRAWPAGSLADPSNNGTDAVWYAKVFDGCVYSESDVCDRLASPSYAAVDGGALAGIPAPAFPEDFPVAWVRGDEGRGSFPLAWTGD